MWPVGVLLNSTNTERSITVTKVYRIVLYQIIVFSDYPGFLWKEMKGKENWLKTV